MNFSKLPLLAITFLLTTSADAQIYKSVDANGRTVFSDSLPSATTSKVKTINSSSSTPPGEQKPTDWAAKDAEFKERLIKRQETASSSKAPLVAKCAAAQTQVDAYNRTRGGTYYRTDAEGNRRELSDSEREEFESKIRKVAEDRCR